MLSVLQSLLEIKNFDGPWRNLLLIYLSTFGWMKPPAKRLYENASEGMSSIYIFSFIKIN